MYLGKYEPRRKKPDQVRHTLTSLATVLVRS